MNVLVLYETSGKVREAFRSRGHNAWSCDILPAADGSPHHFQCDIDTALLGTDSQLPLCERLGAGPATIWDLIIAHPSCTYLTSSAAWAYKDPDYDRYPGVGYHQRVKPGTLTGAPRRVAREHAIAVFKAVYAIPEAKHVCVENPARGALSKAFMPPTQVIHPHQFGHDASKATGLWLRELPSLVPTLPIPPRMVDGKPRWANQTDSGQNRLPPGDDRWRIRSETYSGIADAMAYQWGAS